jgi:alkylation response protein AidB-like acyl-CoA dehydrogenase
VAANPVLATAPGEDPLDALIRDALKPQVTTIDLDGTYPADFLRRLGAMGGFGGLVAERYGGTGRGLADVIATIEAVSQECLTTGFLVWCHAFSPIERAQLGTLAEITSLALSGSVSSSQS